MEITGYHARCDWCGTDESIDWVASAGRLYCSQECKIAGEFKWQLLMVITGLALFLFFLGDIAENPFILLGELPFLYFAYLAVRSHRIRQRIPKGDRYVEN